MEEQEAILNSLVERMTQKVPLTEVDVIPMLGWNEQPEMFAKMKVHFDLFVDYVIHCLHHNREPAKVPYYICIVIKKATDEPDGADRLPKIAEFFKSLTDSAETLKLVDSNSDWGSTAQFLLIPLQLVLVKHSKYFGLFALSLIKLCASKHVGSQCSSLIMQIQMSSPRAFVNYAEEAVKTLAVTHNVAMFFDGLYKFKPDPFHDNMQIIYDAFLSADLSPKITLLNVVWNISKASPKHVTLFLASPEFREALFSPMFGNTVAMTVKEVAVVDATMIADWTDDLLDALKINPNMIFFVVAALGHVARIDENHATKILGKFVDLFKQNEANSMALGQVLQALKNIQDKFKDLVSNHAIMEQVRASLSNTEAAVRNSAQAIVDVAEAKDLHSVNQKVEETSKNIEVVKEEVKEQNTKIETMETDVKDAKELVATVSQEVAAVSQEVANTTARVDKVETKVEEQAVEIQKILDRFEELNAKVKESCKSVEELKAYVDENVAMLKEFIAEVVKKLPTPSRFTAEGLVRRTLTLYFECGKKGESCMFTTAAPFKTETSDWAKWLKMGFSLFKLGMAVYEGAVLDAVGEIQGLYEEYQQKEDSNFLAYISEPFLTSAEQDSLINQLRDQRFFDLFDYNAQNACWNCKKCSRGEHPVMELEEKALSVAGNGKVQAFVKISVGFMKRITKMWCVIEGNTLVIYDRQQSAKKHAIPLADIVDVQDLDTRVTKRPHSFSIVTKGRTYTACAITPSELDMWKSALMPK